MTNDLYLISFIQPCNCPLLRSDSGNLMFQEFRGTFQIQVEIGHPMATKLTADVEHMANAVDKLQNVRSKADSYQGLHNSEEN